jgi:hypothetical protein
MSGIFGDSTGFVKAAPKVMVPPRSINSIEQELRERMSIDVQCAVSPIWIDGESGEMENIRLTNTSGISASDLTRRTLRHLTRPCLPRLPNAIAVNW